MKELLDSLKKTWGDYLELIPEGMVQSSIRVIVLVFLVLPTVIAFSNVLRKFFTKKFGAQQGLVVQKLVRYAGVILTTMLVFHEFGFSLAPLLGAAGIVGLGIAFASQTSVSNIISGLFLIAERPFSVGDAISVGQTTGIVLSIDTLSVKLRTLDNRFVRIPNETLIQTELINITRFPIRRIDINVGVAYGTDLPKVTGLLKDIATENPLCLMEPAPLIAVTGMGESSVDYLFGVWVVKENFLALRNSILDDIHTQFAENGIEIPFPHRSVIISSSESELPLGTSDTTSSAGAAPTAGG
ncbi:MAG: mechanosensitive ion channel family protein [Verrucomicrobiota bacterium]